MKPPNRTAGPQSRVAVLNSSLGIAQRGGERVLLEVARHLGRCYDVDSFSGGSVPAVPSTEVRPIDRHSWAARMLESITPRSTHRLWRRLHLTPLDVERMTFNLRLLPHLLSENYELIVTQADFWTCLICRVVRRLNGTPFISVSGGLTQSSREALRYRPSGHVVVNPDVETTLKREFPDARIRFIPNGVDLDQFSPGESGIDLPLERPIYLVVGACEPRKRIDLAIKAVAHLERGSLLLLGDGPLRDEWVEMGNRKLGKGRFDQRLVPLTQIADYYRACDVFTLPSVNEPFGLVYLEAMACNRPVVGERDRIREFIVGDGGELCRCDDIESYSSALSRAAVEDHGARPYNQARRFGWSEIGKRYEALVAEILTVKRS
jgi:glycosyltransferase involved in cell wall biosynthesis